MKNAETEYQKLSTGNTDAIDWDKVKPFIGNMAKDIKVQKEHLGGDFVIAQAITSRDMRDHIRTILPDTIFIILSMTQETQVIFPKCSVLPFLI